MPKRASSNVEKMKPNDLGRDLHWYGDSGDGDRQPSEAEVELRKSQADFIRALGRASGYPQSAIEEAVEPRPEKPKYVGKPHDNEIQRIIDAVGLSLKTSTDQPQSKINAARHLSEAIGAAETLYRTAIGVRQFKRTRKEVQLIYSTAQHLGRLLNNEDAWKKITPHIPLLFEVKSEAETFSRGSLDVLICAVKKARQSMANENVWVLTEASAFDILIAELVAIFEAHFDGPPTINSILRFVKCLRKRLAIADYQEGSIIKAITNAHSGRKPRKL